MVERAEQKHYWYLPPWKVDIQHVLLHGSFLRQHITGGFARFKAHKMHQIKPVTVFHILSCVEQ